MADSATTVFTFDDSNKTHPSNIQGRASTSNTQGRASTSNTQGRASTSSPGLALVRFNYDQSLFVADGNHRSMMVTYDEYIIKLELHKPKKI